MNQSAIGQRYCFIYDIHHHGITHLYCSMSKFTSHALLCTALLLSFTTLHAQNQLNSATAASHAQALFTQGEALLSSEDEAQQKDGVKLILQAAEAGYSPAYSIAGDFYAYAFYVEKNPQTAVKWYKKSAEYGARDGQNNLGFAYYQGQGVEKDLKLALHWYLKSAEQGDRNAQHNLALMYLDGDGVEQNDRLALQWAEKSAQQGNDNAQNLLGMMYLDGLAVKKNLQQAVYWFKQAEAQGNRYAHQRIWELCRSGKISKECSH